MADFGIANRFLPLQEQYERRSACREDAGVVSHSGGPPSTTEHWPDLIVRAGPPDKSTASSTVVRIFGPLERRLLPGFLNLGHSRPRQPPRVRSSRGPTGFHPHNLARREPSDCVISFHARLAAA